MSLLTAQENQKNAFMTTNEGNTLNACRSCGSPSFELIDLGDQPLANQLVQSAEDPVETYPLAVHVCESCSLAQLSHCVDKEALYGDYNYITPDSEELKAHYGRISDFLSSKEYLSEDSKVIDIGSNIGRLLSFLKPRVASVLGIDPAANVVDMAIDHGIPTLCRFFNVDSAEEVVDFAGRQDVIFARHCFAHNESPGQILEGIPHVLNPDGVVVIENAYFGDTVAKGEFDQVYHEHMYYYSLRGISGILEQHGLKLVDAHHSDIHGGTMVFVAKLADAAGEPSETVKHFLELEADMHKPEFYSDFLKQIETNRAALRQLIEDLNANGKTIQAYGASAKATTLLNYYGITHRQMSYVVDCTPTKHGKLIPVANLEVISEEESLQNPPDYYVLTIWNYKDEIIRKVRAAGNHHTKFIMPHPTVEILDA